MNKDKVLKVRVDESELQKLKAIADKHGVSMSAAVRVMIHAEYSNQLVIKAPQS